MLKRYTDYSNKELSEMTDEEIEKLVDIECMLAGVVSKRIEPIYMKDPDIPEPDANVYKVGDFMFTRLEDAERVKDCVNACESTCRISYDYAYGYENGYLVSYSDPVSVDKKSTYTRDTYDRVKDIFVKRDKVKKDNEYLKKQFNSESESYKEIRDKVENAVYEAIKKQSELETAKIIYERYLNLSNGDALTAEKFFLETEFAGFLNAIKGCDEPCTT